MKEIKITGLTHDEKRNKGETVVRASVGRHISGCQTNHFSDRPLFLGVSPEEVLTQQLGEFPTGSLLTYLYGYNLYPRQ